MVLNHKVFKHKDSLTLFSINMAHGRGEGENQIFQSNDIIKKYVDKIGNLVKRESADIVALQESDDNSWWSGNFSHTQQIAKIADLPYVIQGKNIDGLGLSYGASIITNLNIINAKEYTFPMSFPTFNKGFVLATCQWDNLSFNVISLHLDFARSSVRKKQLNILYQSIKEENKPIIILGDFNTDISNHELYNFIQSLSLKTWKPNDTSIITFPPMGGSRIDWILVSTEFTIIEQKVLKDTISDHKAVRATIVKKT